MEINEALKEALAQGMAVVIYQTDKGPGFGFIEVDAITEITERVEQDGSPYWASAIAVAEGGDITKVEDFTGSVFKALGGLWGTAREMLVGEET